MANILTWLAIYNVCTASSSGTNRSGIKSNNQTSKQKNRLKNKKLAKTKIKTKHKKNQLPSCSSDVQDRSKIKDKKTNKKNGNSEHTSPSSATNNMLSTGIMMKTCPFKTKTITVIFGSKELKIVVIDIINKTSEGYKINKNIKIEGNDCRCIKTRALSEIQEQLVNYPEDKFPEKISECLVDIIQLGLIIGNEIEKTLIENEQDPKQYASINKLPKNDRDNMRAKSIRFLKRKNNEKMNKEIYKGVLYEDILLKILLFFYDYPETLRSNRNNQYNICHDVVMVIVIDYLVEHNVLTVYIFAEIVEFKNDNHKYVDFLNRSCYSVIISLSAKFLYGYFEKMHNAIGVIEKEMKDLYVKYNIPLKDFTKVNIDNDKNFEFIEDNVEYLIKKLYKQILSNADKIWAITHLVECTEISDENEIFCNVRSIIDNNIFHLEEKFYLMLEGHDNLCELIRWQIKQKNEDKKTILTNVPNDNNTQQFVESDDIPKEIVEMLQY